MTPDTLMRLEHEFSEFPIMRAQSVPNAEEVEKASRTIGIPFTDDYRGFLLRYGGAVVGPYPIFGLRPCEARDNAWSVLDMTKRYRVDYEQAGIDCVSQWVVFSEDHAGNPVGFDATGEVWIFDHDFGGLHHEAPSFEAYLRHKCLGLNESS